MPLNLHLRQQRELRGWSQARLAEELGTSAKVVGRWERGIVFPSPYFRERLCVIFEKDAQALGLLQLIEQEITVEQDNDDHFSIPDATETEREVAGTIVTHQMVHNELPAIPQADVKMKVIRSMLTKQYTFPIQQGNVITTLVLVGIILIAAGTIVSNTFALSIKQLPIVATGQSSHAPVNGDDPQSLYSQATSKAPILADPLTGQTSSDWNVGQTSNGGSCTFSGGMYHVIATSSKHITACFALKTRFKENMQAVFFAGIHTTTEAVMALPLCQTDSTRWLSTPR